MRFLEKFDKQFRQSKPNYDSVKEHIHQNINDIELKNFLDEKLDSIALDFINASSINLANQCHNISQSFYENWMSQEIGRLAPVAITVGNVVYKNTPIYDVSKSSIKRTISEGFNPNKSLELHVWLTFSNMKVLDLTIVPTLIEKGFPTEGEFEKNYVIWEESTNSNFQYIPFLQHNNFMYEVDRIVGNV
jgi:hypothetical protein